MKKKGQENLAAKKINARKVKGIYFYIYIFVSVNIPKVSFLRLGYYTFRDICVTEILLLDIRCFFVSTGNCCKKLLI